MILDKGRSKNPDAVEVEMEDSLEKKLLRLAELKLEVRDEKQKYLEKTKHQREMIKTYEETISEEVKKLHKTVKVEGIKAEYKPQVVFKMKREKNDGEGTEYPSFRSGESRPD